MNRYKVTTDIFADINEGQIIEYEPCNGILIHDGYLVFDSKEIIDRNPDWFEKIEEPEVKEGQYWKITKEKLFPIPTGTVIRVFEIAGSYTRFTSINNSYSGNESIEAIINDATLLSDDEAGQALIKEAKRRGFESGVSIKTIDGYKYYSRSGEYKYNPMRDILYYDHVSVCVQGNFAEIIEDEWEPVRNGMGHVVINSEGKSVGGLSYNLNCKEAEAIAEKLNELD